MSKRDADRLARDLRRYFASTSSEYTLEIRRNHWHVVNADGNSIATFASTPSNDRFRKNAIATLRQRGVIPPGWRS